MLYLTIKALISGAIIAAVSEIAKRSPGLGALVASLPLVSTLGMIWLWRDTQDPARMAAHASSTFWFVRSDEHNVTLSDGRVKAVQAALVAAGIQPDRLQSKGYGRMNPVSSNTDEAGKATNRRVELVKL